MDKELLKEIALKGLIRHGSQGIGGSLIATGLQVGDNKTIGAGLVLSAAAFGWSSFRKWNRRRKERRASRN